MIQCSKYSILCTGPYHYQAQTTKEPQVFKCKICSFSCFLLSHSCLFCKEMNECYKCMYFEKSLLFPAFDIDISICVMLNLDISCFGNSVDPYQLAFQVR